MMLQKNAKMYERLLVSLVQYKGDDFFKTKGCIQKNYEEDVFKYQDDIIEFIFSASESNTNCLLTQKGNRLFSIINGKAEVEDFRIVKLVAHLHEIIGEVELAKMYRDNNLGLLYL